MANKNCRDHYDRGFSRFISLKVIQIVGNGRSAMRSTENI